MAPGENLCFDLIVRFEEQPRPDGCLGGGHDEVDTPIGASDVDGHVGHNLPASLAYCSGVNSKSTLPRPAWMACSTACLQARSRRPLPRRIISSMESGLLKVRAGATAVRRSSARNVQC